MLHQLALCSLQAQGTHIESSDSLRLNVALPLLSAHHIFALTHYRSGIALPSLVIYSLAGAISLPHPLILDCLISIII